MLVTLPSGIVVGRGLHKQDPENAILRKPVTEHELIMGSLRSLRGEADLRAFVWKVLNQSISETCWAHSGASAKYIVDMIAHGKASMTSPLFFAQLMYALYRAQQTPAGQPLPGPGLVDGGAQLDDACSSWARFGSQPFGKPQQDGDTDVPATQDENGEPILLPELGVPETESGIRTPFGGAYDIKTGPGAGDLVAASLEVAKPVWFGTLVGQAFQRLRAGEVAQPCDPSDPTAGGHAMDYVGYKTVPVNGTQTRRFLVMNSWGPSWMEGGFCWASESFVEANWSALPFEDNAL